ncbi:hypothetical protein [Frigoriglobus tundricola]|uniref:Uncharacterized protein n=1 Tax=Frigoriglobus tundricola TaxID=2774151 RepID=A0A6M5YL83_9BACT|nr:hypothetical protein [Frigoriglobus tundricola]QJW93762.1 hypothetical protein FTUN_1273 [Frigoriglobus tundricola]
MGEWLRWAFGWACGALAVLKFAAGLWCWVELRRKWLELPELWGVDWLDIVFRVERAFGMPLTAADFAGWTTGARVGLTAGQLWELVADKLRGAGAEVPADGWERVVAVLSEALNVRAERIATESRLCADLDMGSGPE